MRNRGPHVDVVRLLPPPQPQPGDLLERVAVLHRPTRARGAVGERQVGDLDDTVTAAEPLPEGLDVGLRGGALEGGAVAEGEGELPVELREPGGLDPDDRTDGEIPVGGENVPDDDVDLSGLVRQGDVAFDQGLADFGGNGLGVLNRGDETDDVKGAAFFFAFQGADGDEVEHFEGENLVECI